MRTIVYVDAFNLYFRLLAKQPKYKWLDVAELARQVLSPKNVLIRVNYYTARVSGRLDHEAPARQQIYLDALATIPEIKIHLGNFLISEKWAGLVHPPQTRPTMEFPRPWPHVVKVIKVEEKGSDVNIASHLVRDSFKNEFDVAAILSNDTDLVEPVRILTQELGKTVGILSPVARPAASLARVAKFVRHIRADHLKAAQLPDPIPGSTIARPPTWV